MPQQREKRIELPRDDQPSHITAFAEATMMSKHALGTATNAENSDALMTFYADNATLVIEPGRCVTGQNALREAFTAIAEHFTHTLRVSGGIACHRGGRHCTGASENARVRGAQERRADVL